jgi:excisionase family DNA binding protein
MDTLDRLLSVQDLADYLGVPVATIYTWRHRGHGPPGFRVGRHLRFRTSDVTKWINQRINGSQTEQIRVRADG